MMIKKEEGIIVDQLSNLTTRVNHFFSPIVPQDSFLPCFLCACHSVFLKKKKKRLNYKKEKGKKSQGFHLSLEAAAQRMAFEKKKKEKKKKVLLFLFSSFFQRNPFNRGKEGLERRRK